MSFHANDNWHQSLVPPGWSGQEFWSEAWLLKIIQGEEFIPFMGTQIIKVCILFVLSLKFLGLILNLCNKLFWLGGYLAGQECINFCLFFFKGLTGHCCPVRAADVEKRRRGRQRLRVQVTERCGRCAARYGDNCQLNSAYITWRG